MAEFTTGGPEIAVIARDIEAMLRFYRDGLGLEDIDVKHNGWGKATYMRCGASKIKIFEVNQGPPAASNPPSPAETATGVRWVTLRVKHIERTIEDCVRAGATVLHPLANWDSHTKYAFVLDPDGNQIELVEEN
jgi:catechol 2,3-dioxygenase-like lactoylglutathione lyase family enzyme